MDTISDNDDSFRESLQLLLESLQKTLQKFKLYESKSEGSIRGHTTGEESSNINPILRPASLTVVESYASETPKAKLWFDSDTIYLIPIKENYEERELSNIDLASEWDCSETARSSSTLIESISSRSYTEEPYHSEVYVKRNLSYPTITDEDSDLSSTSSQIRRRRYNNIRRFPSSPTIFCPNTGLTHRNKYNDVDVISSVSSQTPQSSDVSQFSQFSQTSQTSQTSQLSQSSQFDYVPRRFTLQKAKELCGVHKDISRVPLETIMSEDDVDVSNISSETSTSVVNKTELASIKKPIKVTIPSASIETNETASQSSRSYKERIISAIQKYVPQSGKRYLIFIKDEKEPKKQESKESFSKYLTKNCYPKEKYSVKRLPSLEKKPSSFSSMHLPPPQTQPSQVQPPSQTQPSLTKLPPSETKPSTVVLPPCQIQVIPAKPPRRTILKSFRKPNLKRLSLVNQDTPVPSVATNLFKDGIRVASYILVYSNVNTATHIEQIEYLLSSLEHNGLEVEAVTDQGNRNLVFVKLHLPRATMLRHIEKRKMQLCYMLPYTNLQDTGVFPWMSIELYQNDSSRNPEALSGLKPQDATSAEKIMIVHHIVNNSKYGREMEQYGVNEMISQGVVLTAYPLHDGNSKWTWRGPLSDRQGAYFTYPGDKNMWIIRNGINADRCDPSGCTADLSIYIGIVLCIKIIYNWISSIFFILYYSSRKTTALDNTQWELDFELVDVNWQLYIFRLYIEPVIAYGFVIFFTAVFPLAPFLVLIDSTITIRINAIIICRFLRRPVPRQVVNLEIWNGILQIMTVFGIVTNAFVMAFTNDIVPRTIHRLNPSNDEAYIFSTLSKFRLGDYADTSWTDGWHNQYRYWEYDCLYSSKRGTDYDDRYTYNKYHYRDLSYKYVFVNAVVFASIIFTFLFYFLTWNYERRKASIDSVEVAQETYSRTKIV
ncbi:hypothetical protein ILUMI_03204 [Ignelater luminosus]|uniref:Anoctamin n=1 Tax=Ignelater luminosus TaxID=2038154 RepID=A0A8K0DGZ0_IGNLU|nr:hypothetical protein ILUMI_03204 [Ignelater luminosus]